MKMQFLNGGLANQAFQYIFTRYYELSHPGQIIYMDDSYFALHTIHNGYELEKVFGIRPHMLSECFDKDVWDYMLEQKKAGKSIPQTMLENGMEVCMVAEVDFYEEFNPFEGKVWRIPINQYHPEILDFNEVENIYYHGYWIHEDFFMKYASEFMQEFHFPEITDENNLEYLRQVQEERSACIHIRRGDYVKLGCAASKGALAKLVSDFITKVDNEWHLFVFSDDIDWCRQNQEELNLTQFQKTTFVEGNINGRNYIDMQLMSRCKAMIISNSAFCYLATLLNREKQYCMNPTSRGVGFIQI